jgi:hypothetical protein
LGYAAVYQQQPTVHWKQQNYFIVGMESLWCGKLSGDWPWALSAIYCRVKKYIYTSTPFLRNYGPF